MDACNSIFEKLIKKKKKINSCLVTPNCIQNHVVIYTNRPVNHRLIRL